MLYSTFLSPLIKNYFCFLIEIFQNTVSVKAGYQRVILLHVLTKQNLWNPLFIQFVQRIHFSGYYKYEIFHFDT